MKKLKPQNKKVFTPEEKKAWLDKKLAKQAKADEALNAYLEEMEKTGNREEAERKFREGNQ